MKDIDFDELDKAVSSVLGQHVPSDDKVDTTIDSKETDVLGEEKPPKAAPAAAPDKGETPKVAPKRRGRFMDMVQPGVGTSKPRAFQTSSRTAPSIVPLDPSPPETSQKSSEKQLYEGGTRFDDQKPAQEDLAPLHEALPSPDPEPLLTATVPSEADMKAPNIEASMSSDTKDADMDNVVDSSEKVDVEPRTENEPSLEPPTTATLLVDTVPQSTPFLTDTKVEKRPLGGFGSEENTDDAQSGETSPSADTQKPPTVPLPRELQADVVGIESPADDFTPPGANSPFATNIAAAAEHGEDERVEGHPVFDTSTYHEPIATVAKHSVPTWLKWLLGLLMCLAVGAGIGYFLFTAGL